MGAPLQFLIEAFEHVGRLHVLVVREWQPVIGQRLLDVLFDPSHSLQCLACHLASQAAIVATDLDELVGEHMKRFSIVARAIV
jgi:hypothetical protein